jgi:hypothetical protein
VDHREAGETLAEPRGAGGVEFYGDDPGAGLDQGRGQGAFARPDVED